MECVLDFFGSSIEYIRADVIQQGLQDTRKHARGRYLDIAASKSEDAGREYNFQYKKKICRRSPNV